MTVTEYNDTLVTLMALSTKSCGYKSELDEMGATPLCETILLATEIVKDFRNKNKIEVANVVFLTDGSGAVPENALSYGATTVLRDTKTQETITFKGQDKYFDWTNAFLVYLKKQTNCNLVGFYIIQDTKRIADVFYQRPSGREEYSAARSDLRKNGYFKIRNSGYDDYYLIMNTRLIIDHSELFSDVNNTAKQPKVVTKKSRIKAVAEELTKYMEKKNFSRLLLTDFIKRIA